MEGTDTYSEIDTVIELIILIMMSSFALMFTAWSVQRFTTFASSRLERDKVMVSYQEIEDILPYDNLTGYEAYMMNWIMSDSIDMTVVTLGKPLNKSTWTVLSTRENGSPIPNYSVYIARKVTGYSGTTPNVRTSIKEAPYAGTLVDKYRGNNFGYSLQLTGDYYMTKKNVYSDTGQLLENKEIYSWTLIPNSIP